MITRLANIFIFLFVAALTSQAQTPRCPQVHTFSISENIVLEATSLQQFRMRYEPNAEMESILSIDSPIEEVILSPGKLKVRWHVTERTRQLIRGTALFVDSDWKAENVKAEALSTLMPIPQEGPDGQRHPVDPIYNRSQVVLEKIPGRFLFSIVERTHEVLLTWILDEEKGGKTPSFDKTLIRDIETLFQSDPSKFYTPVRRCGNK